MHVIYQYISHGLEMIGPIPPLISFGIGRMQDGPRKADFTVSRGRGIPA
jgi:hypothetical protein